MSDYSSLPPPPSGGYGDFQQQGYGYVPGAAPVQLAGFWIRFAAALLDGLILAVPGFILGLIVVANGDGSRFTTGVGFTPGANITLQLAGIVLGTLYYGLQEGGASGQTVGKRACGIRVVDVATGQPGIGVARGVGRYFARFLSQIVIYLGYLWMLWDPKKQTWHDKLCRTVVVRA